MNAEAQRIAIAEACGWTECHPATKTPHGFFEAYGRKKLPYGSRKDERLPDYVNDLNAMHEAEKVLSRGEGYHQEGGFGLYKTALEEVCDEQHPIDANAAQRAEAFLRSVGKWEGDK